MHLPGALGGRGSALPPTLALAVGLVVAQLMSDALFPAPAVPAGPAPAVPPSHPAAAPAAPMVDSEIVPTSPAGSQGLSETATPAAAEPTATPAVAIAPPISTRAARPGSTGGPTPSPAPSPTPDRATRLSPARPVDPGLALATETARVEAGLRSGELSVALDYGDAPRQVARVTFDFGDAARPPRLHYRAGVEGQAPSLERIVVGTRAWQRSARPDWMAETAQASVWEQVQTFLPHLVAVSNPRRLDNQEVLGLQWHDAARSRDATLVLDPASGAPWQLTEVEPNGGPTLTTTFLRWNAEVTIDPPEAP